MAISDWRKTEIVDRGSGTSVGYRKPITPGRGNCFDGIEIQGISREDFIAKPNDWKMRFYEKGIVTSREPAVEIDGVRMLAHRIINLRAESMDALFEQGVLTYPIKVRIPAEGFAYVVDIRVPAEYLTNRICTTCIPILSVANMVLLARKEAR